MILHDVAIVGAGPLGLATAAELQRRQLRIVQFEKNCLAHTIQWFPLGMRFYSSPQHLELLDFPLSTQGEKPTREEYLAYLRAFTRYHRLQVRTYESVTRIEAAGGEFQLESEQRGQSARFRAQRVVLAIGSTAVPRQLGIPGEDLPHVAHYFVDPHTYYGQRVLIVGARNSACDAAIQLARLGCAVTLVHRRPEIETRFLKYWLHPELMGLIRAKAIATRLQAIPEVIDAQGMTIRHLGSGEREYLPCDFILLMVGYEPDFTLIDQLGLETEGPQRVPVVHEQTLESSVPGVYCCGTIVAGNQNPYRIFIENAQSHPLRVADAIERALRQK